MSNEEKTVGAKYPTLTQAMVTKLRAACVVRQNLSTKFFQSRVIWLAQSISTDSRSLYHGTKSHILKRFDKGKQLPMYNREMLH